MVPHIIWRYKITNLGTETVITTRKGKEKVKVV